MHSLSTGKMDVKKVWIIKKDHNKIRMILISSARLIHRKKSVSKAKVNNLEKKNL